MNYDDQTNLPLRDQDCTPDQLEELVESGNTATLVELLAPRHPAEVAEYIGMLDSDSIVKILALLPPAKAGIVLDELNEHIREKAIEQLDDELLSSFLSNIAVDKATDILNFVPIVRKTRLINTLSLPLSSELRKLQRYDRKTAGGLMSTDYITITMDTTIRQVEEIARQKNLSYGYQFCVVNRWNELVGALRFRDILFTKKSDPIGRVVKPNPLSVKHTADQEEVAQLFLKYDLMSLPVVDERNKLIGIITVDDVLEVIQDEGSEDMFMMAGTFEKAPLSETILSKVSKRFPWLLITMGGGIACSVILKQFQPLLATQISISFFIPLIMSMAGNISIQSSTIMVRSIAVGNLGIEHQIFKSISKEIIVGTLLGIFLGGLVSGMVALITSDIRLGLTVLFAMIVSIFFASSLGVLIPFSVNKIGIDPAIVSGPFVTSLNDILGITIYLTMIMILH